MMATVLVFFEYTQNLWDSLNSHWKIILNKTEKWETVNFPTLDTFENMCSD